MGLLVVPLVVFLWLGGSRLRAAVAPSRAVPDATTGEAPPEETEGARIVFGSVNDDKGEPVSGASVALAGGSAHATTGVDGSYRLSAVPPEAGELTVSADGYRGVNEALPAGAPGS